MSAAAVKAKRGTATENLMKGDGAVHGNNGSDHPACGGRGADGEFEKTASVITCKKVVCAKIAAEQLQEREATRRAAREAAAVSTPFQVPSEEATPAPAQNAPLRLVADLPAQPADAVTTDPEPTEPAAAVVVTGEVAVHLPAGINLYEVTFEHASGAKITIVDVQATSFDAAEVIALRGLEAVVRRKGAKR